jgi:MmyB-like transcription regulator ligand binding domain
MNEHLFHPDAHASHPGGPFLPGLKTRGILGRFGEELPLPQSTTTRHISPDLQRVLDSFQPHPAFVANERWDVVARNRATSQVFTSHTVLTPQDRNLLWLIFTHTEQRKLYVQWEALAQYMLALFRASEGLYGEDAWFIEWKDLLMQASPEFRAWWPRHDVGAAHVRRKELNHPIVGKLVLQSTTLLVADAPHLKLFLYTPLPEADTASKLAQLASSP